MPDALEVRIEKVVYGGDGLGRVDGQAVFVPFTAPGDRVTVRVTERHKGFLRAEVVSVDAPGPDRREPRCPHAGTCGGCQLQHLDYPAQVAAKAAFVRDALERIGKLPLHADVPVACDPDHEFGYRVRATAHTVQLDTGALFGFYGARSHRIVDVRRCPLLVPELDVAWQAAHSARDRLARARTVELVAGDADAAAAPPVPGIGRGPVAATIHGATYAYGPGSFFQVNRPLVGALVDAVTSGDPSPGGTALELYAGVGLFTVPLARRYGRVVAVESNHEAVARARENLSRNGVSNADVAGADVVTWLSSADARATPFETAVLDPPRTGLGAKGATALARLAPARIVYVACDPATLARDARVLVDAGYRLASVRAFDLFPQTFHVETVAVFERDESPA